MKTLKNFTYELLSGEILKLTELTIEDWAFLFDLMSQAFYDKPYPQLRLLIAGKNAYPLKGNTRVTTEIHSTILYRVAEDIVDRTGISQKMIGK